MDSGCRFNKTHILTIWNLLSLQSLNWNQVRGEIMQYMVKMNLPQNTVHLVQFGLCSDPVQHVYFLSTHWSCFLSNFVEVSGTSLNSFYYILIEEELNCLCLFKNKVDV